MSSNERLRAVIVYCLGVKEDFPNTAVWMDNIIKIAQGNGTK